MIDDPFKLVDVGPVMCRFLGRLHDEAIDGLWRQASEKRQGTKSRAGWGLVWPLLMALSG